MSSSTTWLRLLRLIARQVGLPPHDDEAAILDQLGVPAAVNDYTELAAGFADHMCRVMDEQHPERSSRLKRRPT